MVKDILNNINWLGTLQETLMITSIVIIMILLIEIINIATRESFVRILNKNSFIQILIGTVFGLIPGCMGIFVMVALYSKKIISLGAMIATLIATVGDEAFLMLAIMPKQAFIIFGILAGIAIIVGFLCDKFVKNKFENSFSGIIHDSQHCNSHSHKKHDCIEHHHNTFSFKNLSFSKYKVFLSLIIVAIITLTATNFIGHAHPEFFGNFSFSQENHDHDEDCCDELCCDEHSHAHSHVGHNHDEHGMEVLIIKIILLSFSGILLILLLFSNEHFIKKHLWQHVIKKHLVKIFLWILGTLLVISIVLQFSDIGSWLDKNYFIALAIAILIGIIPQSGPHLIFIVLFVSGNIPFGILLANSIVQDGHGGLPLLAENKKTFIFKKIISIIIAIIVGIFCYFFNF